MNTSMKKRVLALVVTALVAQSSVSAIPGGQFLSDASAKVTATVKNFVLGLWNNKGKIALGTGAVGTGVLGYNRYSNAQRPDFKYEGVTPSQPKTTLVEKLSRDYNGVKTSVVNGFSSVVKTVTDKVSTLERPELNGKNAGIATAVVVGSYAAYKGGKYLYNSYQAKQNEKKNDTAVKSVLSKSDEEMLEDATFDAERNSSDLAKNLAKSIALRHKGQLQNQDGELLVDGYGFVKADVIIEAPKAPTRTQRFKRFFGFDKEAVKQEEQAKQEEAKVLSEAAVNMGKAIKTLESEEKQDTTNKQQEETAKQKNTDKCTTAVKAVKACYANRSATTLETAKNAVAQVTDAKIKTAFTALEQLVNLEISQKMKLTNMKNTMLKNVHTLVTALA